MLLRRKVVKINILYTVCKGFCVKYLKYYLLFYFIGNNKKVKIMLRLNINNQMYDYESS